MTTETKGMFFIGNLCRHRAQYDMPYGNISRAYVIFIVHDDDARALISNINFGDGGGVVYAVKRFG